VYEKDYGWTVARERDEGICMKTRTAAQMLLIASEEEEKERKRDQRLTALSMALDFVGESGSADDVVGTAKKFYHFLEEEVPKLH
jgi:hypothetical protein